MDQQQVQQNSKEKNIHFCCAMIQLLDNANPSAKNCPVDIHRVDCNIIAMYLSSMKTEEGNYKSMSTYNDAWSLIMYLMKQDNVYPPLAFKEKVCTLLQGLCRTIQQQKVDHSETLNEGKDPLSFSGYHLLHKIFLQNNGTNNEFIFAHAFLTLERKLMCHADNLVSLNVNHIGWEDDLLLCNLAKAEHGQEGEGAKMS